MRSRQIVAVTFARAFERDELREIGMTLLRERGNERRDRSGERRRRGGKNGVQVSEGKKKDDNQEDGGGVQPRWHENEA